MKIQIDTEARTITLEEAIKFCDLIKSMENLFPNGEWNEYTLEVKVIQNWNNPITIPCAPYEPYQPPFRPGDIIYNSPNTSNGFSNNGIYNLEFKL